jgi:hypothetical protein
MVGSRPSVVESHLPGYRSRQSPFFGETGKDALLTPGKNTKRGNGRVPGESHDGEERLSFGRGLASSGRPRNLCVYNLYNFCLESGSHICFRSSHSTRRTDSGILGRNQTVQDEHPDLATLEIRNFDRTERKDRSWVKADAKDTSEGDAATMGRFATKGALKLQSGDDVCNALQLPPRHA